MSDLPFMNLPMQYRGPYAAENAAQRAEPALHINQQAQHKITPPCKWGLDVCPFDVAHKRCSTCRYDKA